MRLLVKNLKTVLPILAAFAICVAGLAGQEASPSSPHVTHLTSSFPAGPGGHGLVVIAAQEANTVMMHANFAAGDPANLEAMKTHAGHVLHALDPQSGSQGPGLGFGLVPAVEAIVEHLQLARSAPGASAAVRTQGPDLEAAARAVGVRAGRIAALAGRIRAATTAEEAAPLTVEMRTLALQLDTGEGNDVGAGQGGLTHVEAQAYEILVGEGLLRVLR
ncbi:MAG: hypothetical protein FJ207_07925 [Gemmatimonadetes bacterium]|nr:hypothetical protein [Gemmatimonadota bacterium]